MIELKNLEKRYGNFCAVNDISLTIEPGEIFAFLGVNGAGKTTTIRMMTGILQPTAGSISIGGFDLSKNPEKAKSITGYIPDRPYIYPKLTGREFLYFVGSLYKVSKKECAKRVQELLQQFSLVEWQNEMVESYSHGMKQRLATCAALVHKPKILIVDEPMVGLDPRGARMFKDALREFADRGMTIFLSTHSLDVAEELADRLAIIQKGKIISIGTLNEIKARSGFIDKGLELLFLQLTEETLPEELVIVAP
ncbi:MAG: ABC transporter ATP-binding protein [bacterium]|nr:ABC transporter ATP-binding protein [bacterium]